MVDRSTICCITVRLEGVNEKHVAGTIERNAIDGAKDAAKVASAHDSRWRDLNETVVSWISDPEVVGRVKGELSGPTTRAEVIDLGLHPTRGDLVDERVRRGSSCWINDATIADVEVALGIERESIWITEP